jgi:hypothetical protein
MHWAFLGHPTNRQAASLEVFVRSHAAAATTGGATAGGRVWGEVEFEVVDVHDPR